MSGSPDLVRFDSSPLIHPALDASIGTNLNGPSVIRVPEWVPRPLGRYYLYFAHHQGAFIRLAYADDLRGPWRIYAPGVLPIAATTFVSHVASPDLHVDHDRRLIVMYYHGCLDRARHGMNGQRTGVAVSGNGLDFEDRTVTPLGPFYARIFELEGRRYALAKRIDSDGGGILLRGKGPAADSPFEVEPMELGPHVIPNMRHAAVRLESGSLDVYFSRGEDCPERILRSRIDLSRPWPDWRASAPEEVLAPETDYEGADLPLTPSRFGAIHERSRQLRDPCIFEEGGRSYLFYSIAGEAGIAGAELIGDS